MSNLGMDGLVGANALLLNSVGVWVAFLFSLMVFSGLAGDNAISRLAQHILLGAGLGYAAVLAVRHVLVPRLLQPLVAGQMTLLETWMPILLGTVLFVAGMDRIILQSTGRTAGQPALRRGLYASGRLVVALLLGIGLGAGIMGALQGTIIPQYVRAARTGLSTNAQGYGPFVGIFTLLLTTATLLHLFVLPSRHLRHQPAYVRAFMSGWLWIGQRALWFTMGLVFARLIASRLSLLIARIAFLIQTLEDYSLWF